MIRKLIEEIALALDAQLNRLALLASLAVPDIAGALDSTDGRATRSRYIK